MRFKQKAAFAGGLWGISAIITFLYHGLLGLTNPFRYWLAFLEAIEFLLFIPSNLDMLPLLFAFPMSREVVLIWIGLPALFGWIVGIVTVLQAGRSIRHIAAALSIFLFNPVLALLGIWYVYRIHGGEADSEAPSAAHAAD